MYLRSRSLDMKEGFRRYLMKDWLIMGAIGLLVLIVFQAGQQESRDISLQAIVSLHSQDR